MGRFLGTGIILTALAASSAVASVSVRLTAGTSTIPVGETVTVTATASDSTNSHATFTYQFTVRPGGIGNWIVTKNFYHTNTFSWTPIGEQGFNQIGVTALSSTGATGTAVFDVDVTSRVTGSTPVISSTRNPLVALYSAPPCASPNQVRVLFSASAHGQSQVTPAAPCNGLSLNFYLAGMRENTTYYVQQQELRSGSVVSVGPQMTYRTGSIPSDIVIPNHFRLTGPALPTSVTYPFELRAPLGPATFATDLNENVVWYLPLNELGGGYLTRLVTGGTLLAIMSDQPNDQKYLRELDLAGNIIRETNWTVLNQEMNSLRASQGKPPVRLIYFSHEALRLPNGYTATLVTDEQVRNQGAGPVDVLGDAVVVLDTNLGAVWTWDAFDSNALGPHITREAVIPNSVCTQGGPGCPPKFYNLAPNGQPYTKANDWTHANSIYYDPSDGNLIVSLRNQAWVLKLAYENGRGNGNTIWTLGYQGSFSLPGGSPVSDWFVGQHDVEIQSANGLLTLFDNNNANTASGQTGGTAHGQAWRLDLTHMIATPVVNINLGVVSPAVGSAQFLVNGSSGTYDFQAGFIDGNQAQSFEYTPSGELLWRNQTDSLSYRGFRLSSMYAPTNGY